VVWSSFATSSSSQYTIPRLLFQHSLSSHLDISLREPRDEWAWGKAR